jgi:DNA repair photolyase
MIVGEISCKSILTHCRIGGVDYALNPYVGCQHGCIYCYAVFMKRFTGHREAWGQFVDARVTAPEVLARQIRRARPGSITIGTVTDAYQPLERKYRLTRHCLEVLVPYPGFPTTILTKSDLVLRDLDILHQMNEVEVAFTVTTLDDAVRQGFEPNAAPVRRRLNALAQLHTAGIRTWAFFGPVLPGFSDSEAAVDAMFAALAQTGVSHVLVDKVNAKGGSWWNQLCRGLARSYPAAEDGFRLALRDEAGYARMLADRVERAGRKHPSLGRDGPCDSAQ